MSAILTYADPAKMDARREDDFYPTPWEPTDALLDAEKDVLAFYPRIWEPACGDGAMARQMQAHGFKVWSSDLIDRGFGDAHFDFLNFKGQRAPKEYTAIITNPPFVLAEDFIRQAHALGMDYIAMLLKAHYFHADSRIRLFHDHRPARIYPLGWRVDFTGGGANHTDCSWYVWDRSHTAAFTAYMPPLKKPLCSGTLPLL